VQGTLATYVQSLTNTVGGINTLYNNYYLKATGALKAYVDATKTAAAQGRRCDPGTACGDARARFFQERDAFLNRYTSGDDAAYNTHIHEDLVPNPTGFSAVKAYGEYLMSTNGFLSSAQSDQLRGFYNYYASYEALATYMKAQWQGVDNANNPNAVAGKTDFQDFLRREVTGYQESEQAALPPMIPQHVVIALGGDAAERTSTQNKQMVYCSTPFSISSFRAPRDDLDFTDAYWKPDEAANFGNDVPGRLASFASLGGPAGFKNWGIPTPADWDSIFSGWKEGTPASLLTTACFPDPTSGNALTVSSSYAATPRIWTSGFTSFDNTCKYDTVVGRYLVHHQVAVGEAGRTVLNVNSPLSSYPNGAFTAIRGPLDGVSSNSKERCITASHDATAAYFKADIHENQALPLFTRGTGDVNYMG
jgi:hypothetical protein